MVRVTYNLSAGSPVSDLVAVIQQMEQLGSRDLVRVKRGDVMLNNGKALRRNKAVQFFNFMVHILLPFDNL